MLDGVHLNGDRLIVKRANKPLAAIVPIETYEAILQQREKTFSVLDRIWENVPAVSEEEAQADIEQAIAEGRVEKVRKLGYPNHFIKNAGNANMTRDEIIKRFQNLNVWQSKGQRAVHKPLLVLYAIGKLLRGESRLTPYTDIETNLPDLLREFWTVA